MSRTIEQIEADIAAVKANPNWARNEATLKAIAAFTNEKNELTGKNIPMISCTLRMIVSLISVLFSSLYMFIGRGHILQSSPIFHSHKVSNDFVS